MALEAMHRGDERPYWQATVTVNGATEDLSTGYTFTVLLKNDAGTTALTKTTNITGSASGVVTVAWADAELDLAPGTYRAILTATRTSDSAEWTIEDRLPIVAI